jgi:excisionase family DNA binding protein
MDDLPKTLSIPEAGARYFGLSRNGSYDAAERGEIPFIQIGRLRRVPVQLMEKMLAEAATKTA